MDLFFTLVGIAGAVLLFGLYMIPAIVAHDRGHHNALAIGVLNFMLGWTFIGWVIALVWACTAVKPPMANPPTNPEAL